MNQATVLYMGNFPPSLNKQIKFLLLLHHHQRIKSIFPVHFVLTVSPPPCGNGTQLKRTCEVPIKEAKFEQMHISDRSGA